MKKGIYIAIITIVTIVCIFVGTFIHVFHNGSGYEHGFFNGDDDYAERIVEDGDIEIMNDFTRVSVDVDAVEIVIVSGEEYSVAYAGEEKARPTYEVKAGVLTIKQKSSGISWSTDNDRLCVVTVPTGKTLSSVTIKSDAADINVTDLTITNLNVTCDAGDVDISTCEIGTLKLSLDAGDIDIDSCQLTNTDITSDAGDISIYGLDNIDKLNVNLQVDAGEISFNGDDRGMSFQQKGTVGMLKVRCDLGDIEIE